MINQVVLKLNRACNLRCTYCYYINDATDTPGLRMPWSILSAFLDKYTDYCNKHAATGRVVFHGGEPLLMGRSYIQRALSHVGFRENILHASIQTNGVLLDSNWLDLLRNSRVAVGISLDGPPEVHDMHRITAGGRGSYSQVLRSIRLMQARGDDVGVLAVVNPLADGHDVFHHFVHLGIKRIDFLLPQTNRAIQRANPTELETITAYLVKAFLAWYTLDDPTIRVRLFRELMKRYAAETPGYAPIGISSWQNLAIIETDGAIAPLEELAEADRYDGIRRYDTGLNISDVDIDDAETHLTQFWRSINANVLPSHCRQCEVNYICNGGNVGTRFDATGSFDNPGAYCDSLYTLAKLIERLLGNSGYSRRGGSRVACLQASEP